MKKRTNRTAATLSPAAAKRTTAHPITGRRGVQLTLTGMPPPPEPGEGPVELYLRTRPPWHDRLTVGAALNLTEREVREQSENSGGLIIFGSRRGNGLRHALHAEGWELRACQAELTRRAQSHLRRADEIGAILRQREAGR